MRIGFFTDTFIPQTNGVVTSICDFGAELVNRGHKVSVFSPKTSVKMHSGMRVHSYASVPFRPYPEYKIAFPVSTRSVQSLDIVHCHGPFSLGVFGLRVAQKQGKPAVATFHTLLPEYAGYVRPTGVPPSLIKKIAWTYCKHHYNQYDLVITPSKHIKAELGRRGVKKPVTVIPNSVDLKFFSPVAKARARARLGLQEDGRVFLYLGRLGLEKNIDVLIRAVAGKDCLLLIAGAGPAEQKLRAAAQRAGAHNVSFQGFAPKPLLPYYYSAADAFITSSETETQCITAVEAMACGTPVIAVDALALPGVVRHGKNGFLFKNPRELRQLLAEFKPSARLCRNALKTAAGFSVKKCTNLLEDAYKTLS